jgi:predicted RNase H-like nuclease
VAEAAAQEANLFGWVELVDWCRSAGAIARPQKSDQDKLDSALCVLIALRWRLRAREVSLFIGDLRAGYMVLPAT